MLDYLGELIKGLVVTLELYVLGLVIGYALGLTLAIVKVYGGRTFSTVAAAYIEIIRNTPLVVQLFIIYFGLTCIGINRFVACFLTLGLNSGAYQAEYFRGAIEAISGGQMVAARSMGMSKLQAIRHIILPQALILALPGWSNEAAYLPKYTSVAFLIAVPELLSRAKIVVYWRFNPFEVYTIVAVIYLAFIATLSKLLDMLYERVKIPGY